MSNVSDGYPKQDNKMSDEEVKNLALQNYKEQSVKKSNFPTEIIDLPSKGFFYPEGSVLASGKIEMKYMTAREEDILTSQNLIQKGIVLDKLFQALIISPINYNDLLIGDKNAIMIAARILGYGKDYEVEISDPTAKGEKQKVTINLTEIVPDEYDFDSLTPNQNEFEITLPNSNRQLTFQLMTHGLDIKIKEEIKGQLKQAKATGIDRELTTRLKNTILSVDGNRERQYINNFVDNELFAGDSRFLRESMKSKGPDMDMTFIFTSNSTGESQVMDIPMDVSFFWPRV